MVPLGELEPAELEPDPAGGAVVPADGVVGDSGGERRHTGDNVREIGVTSDGTVPLVDGTRRSKAERRSACSSARPAARIDVAGENLYVASA